MTQQIMLAFSRPPIRADREEPKLWVKEFAIYSDFKENKEIRHLSLRRGLNIIWAKESETGASGHAAGKSTFCRLLRYLIGDLHFGTETFRPALRAKFPDAILAGEVILNGEPWLICRPLSIHGHHWCAPGHRLEELFNPDLPKKEYSSFTNALHAAFITPMGLENYPGTEKPLEWLHLLQWLSRDQDARYSDNLQWRASDGERTLLNSHKTNLIRLVLGHLEEGELLKQEAHSKLLKDRTDLKTRIPKLQFARDRSITELAKKFPELRGENYDRESTLMELQHRLGQEKEKLEEKQTQQNTHDGVGEVLQATLNARKSEKDRLSTQVSSLERQVQSQALNLRYQKKEITAEELKQEHAKLGDVEGKCSVSLSDPRIHECPLAPRPDRDEIQAERLQQATGSSERLAAYIESLQQRLAPLRKDLKAAEAKLEEITKRVDDKKKEHTEAKAKIAKDLRDLIRICDTVDSALNDTIEIREAREKQSALDDDIIASTADLAILRKQATEVLSLLSEDFSHVASHLTQSEIHGTVEFHAESIGTSLAYDGDMSSAALVTLRLLILDLACLLGSVRKDTKHPGFLLHDSPREADLSSHIYRRIFTLIAGQEPDQENQALQYIIATTEPPPAHLQSEPWLVCPPLSSETPDDRFLKSIV
jgi:hypothetical protein